MKQPLKLTTRQGERIAVVAGLRTPFAKQASAFHGVPAVDLGKLVVSELLARTDLDPKTSTSWCSARWYRCRKRPT